MAAFIQSIKTAFIWLWKQSYFFKLFILWSLIFVFVSNAADGTEIMWNYLELLHKQ